MSAKDRKQLAVLISGRGSNMVSILEASRDPHFPAEIAMVISDNPEAGGLSVAQNAGVRTAAFSRKDYDSKAEHEAAIVAQIDSQPIDLICLAGYMRLLSGSFTDRYENKLINIHPSLLPKFKGLNTHQRAIDAGETVHGCTIHYVNSEMDGGEIIQQAQVPVLETDTAEELAARVLIEEHRLYPEVVRRLCSSY